jgi:hypothetical protein
LTKNFLKCPESTLDVILYEMSKKSGILQKTWNSKKRIPEKMEFHFWQFHFWQLNLAVIYQKLSIFLVYPGGSP